LQRSGPAKNNVISYALYSLSALNNTSNDNTPADSRDAMREKMTDQEIIAGQLLLEKMKEGSLLKALDHYESLNSKN